MSRLRKRSGGGYKLGREDKDAPARGRLELYKHNDSGLSEGLSIQQRPPSGSHCEVSHMPRRLPAVLRVAGLSSFVLKIILVPCFSLLTSCYLPSVTQDLFFLLVVNGVFAVGCRSLRIFPARSQYEVGTLSASVE